MSPQVSYGSSGGSAGMSSRLSELIDRGDATQRALASRSRGISCSQAAALQRMCRMPISNAAMEGAIEAAALGGLMEASSSAGRSNPSLPRPALAQQGAELTRAKSMGRRGPPGAEQQGRLLALSLVQRAEAAARRRRRRRSRRGIPVGDPRRPRHYVAAARRLAAAGAGGGPAAEARRGAVHFARWRPEEVDGLQRPRRLPLGHVGRHVRALGVDGAHDGRRGARGRPAREVAQVRGRRRPVRGADIGGAMRYKVR